MPKSITYGVQTISGESFDRRGVSRNYVPSSGLYKMGERVSTKEVPVSAKHNGKPAASPYASFDPASKSGKSSAHAEFQKKSQGMTGTSHGKGANGFVAKGKSGAVSSGKDGKQSKGFGAQVKFA